MSKHQTGFTLIELISVIVLLGILAATAVPKFVNLSQAAVIAKLNAMKGSVISGSTMVFAQSVVQDKLTGFNSVIVDGANIAIINGYPQGTWQSSLRYIVSLDNQPFSPGTDTVCTSTWCGIGNQRTSPEGITPNGSHRIARIYPQGYTYNDLCGVYYMTQPNGAAPLVGISTDDC